MYPFSIYVHLTEQSLKKLPRQVLSKWFLLLKVLHSIKHIAGYSGIVVAWLQALGR